MNGRPAEMMAKITLSARTPMPILCSAGYAICPPTEKGYTQPGGQKPHAINIIMAEASVWYARARSLGIVAKHRTRRRRRRRQRTRDWTRSSSSTNTQHKFVNRIALGTPLARPWLACRAINCVGLVFWAPRFAQSNGRKMKMNSVHVLVRGGGQLFYWSTGRIGAEQPGGLRGIN